MPCVTFSFAILLRSNTGFIGLRVANSRAKATGTLQNAAIESCQQKNSEPTNTMDVEITAPHSSPSTWL